MTALAPLPDRVPALAYLRVSREEQARQDKTSLGHQRARIEQLAARLGVSIAAWFEDPGASGGSAERPGFQALLRWCAAHPQPARRRGQVLVYNDARWGRFTNPEEAAYWRVHCERLGWAVRFAESDEVEDLTARTILRAAQGSAASAYREQIRANAKQGARGTAAQGYWQNEAPIGYRREAHARDGRRRVLELGQRKAQDERVRLTPASGDETAFVEWLFQAYAGGRMTLSQLAREARVRWPARAWVVQTVRAILVNRVYLGEVCWGRRPHDAGERAVTPVRGAEAWTVVADAHPPLVGAGTFAQVQARLAQHARQVRRPASIYAFSGLIRCAHCGQPYIGSGGPKGPPGDPDRYRFYRDRAGDARFGAACPGPLGTLQRRIVEPLILEAVGQVVSSPPVLAAIDAALAETTAHLQDDGHRADRERGQRRRELEGQRERLVQAIADGTLTRAEAGPRLAQLRDELAGVGRAAERGRFTAKALRDLGEQAAALRAAARDFPARARQLEGPALRALVEPWLEGATFDKQTRQLALTIAPPSGAQLLGVSSMPPGPAHQRTQLVVCTLPLPPAGGRARRRKAVS